jgi:dGTPase
MQKFKNEAAIEGGPKWNDIIKREVPLYERNDEIRSEFMRDYNRILHSTAYRRLKHKTQVFFATKNDHICTRIEHVNHVASVSYTISKALGLNIELTEAIAIGHDLGHAPFGHEGEKIIKKLGEGRVNDSFWHERNSLRFVDNIETLPDPNGYEKNLDLTYAVRDGIVCHCGEVNEIAIFPRHEAIDLTEICQPNRFSPFTWEGCVVKISDKIAYLGRDIEDALSLNILSRRELVELSKILNKKNNVNLNEINNTVLMHNFIINLCNESNPNDGIVFSRDYLELINDLKKFNYERIYFNKKLDNFKKYAKVVIEAIFEMLHSAYKGKNTIQNLIKYDKEYPLLINYFVKWLIKYSDIDVQSREKEKYQNKIIYQIELQADYTQAILDFISGMTDGYAIKVFDELIRF